MPKVSADNLLQKDSCFLTFGFFWIYLLNLQIFVKDALQYCILIQFETEGNGQNEIFSHTNESEVKL